MGEPWTLRLKFESREELIEAWNVALGEGGFWVRSDEAPRSAEAEVVVLAGREIFAPMPARVVEERSPGEKGYWVRPRPSPELMVLVHESPRAPGLSPTVLVIEDEPIWRSAISRMLKELGCEVHLARDGLEGMRKLTDLLLHLDLVVVDLHLPYFEGGEVMQTVREAGREGDLKLLCLSGGPPDELEAVRRSGLTNLVFSKLDPIDRVADALVALLGLPPRDAAA